MGQNVDTEGLLQAELVNSLPVETAINATHEIPPLLPRFRPAGELNGLDIPFPVSALGKTAAAAVRAIGESSQAPIALCAQTVLGVMSATASMYGDVETLQGRAMPIAIFLMTVAKSGERKSETNTLASGGIKAFEAGLSRTLAEGSSAEICFSEPTYEACSTAWNGGRVPGS